VSLSERARRLVAIAHPAHREALQRAVGGKGATASATSTAVSTASDVPATNGVPA
jgi:acyl-CoA hydrolase